MAYAMHVEQKSCALFGVCDSDEAIEFVNSVIFLRLSKATLRRILSVIFFSH